MCCRYFCNQITTDYINGLTDTKSTDINSFDHHEYHPGDIAHVLYCRRNNIISNKMSWGFPSKNNKLIINARAETALQKPTFSESVTYRRCVIPAAGFYEWSAAKEKYTFTCINGEMMFMAGFFRQYNMQNHFIILTTEANDSMRSVHNRMPLILDKSIIKEWLFDNSAVSDFLKLSSPALNRYTDFEQLSLL